MERTKFSIGNLKAYFYLQTVDLFYLFIFSSQIKPLGSEVDTSWESYPRVGVIEVYIYAQLPTPDRDHQSL